MNDEKKLEYIREHLGVFADFPQKGILFRDLFTALTDGKACQYVKDLMVSYVKSKHPDIDLIVGLESRGFLFMTMIAAELGVGCAPVRKKGKLPGQCVSVEYMKEYGPDVFEMQVNAIKPGQKILIVDDLIATGGSLEAAIKLIRKAGGVIAECLVLIELESLGARQKMDCKIHSLIQY